MHKDPKSFCDTLKEKYKCILKGVGPISYHLGCGYTRDEDGTLVADPRKYVEKILESYEKMFGEKCLCDQNKSTILSKHWEHAKVKDTEMLQKQICSMINREKHRQSCCLRCMIL